ncbi:MAG: 2-C-methyl-D-erythritol 2,4-cyclodiphosphate synthase [Phycisphaerae bacterium]
MHRVGIGTDLHRTAPGRKLVLGGVAIDSDVGLIGHSDADVVLHAVTDALLGASGLDDIGELYPDTDPQWAGADSGMLLREAMVKLRAKGFEPVNVDVVVHAERPKLSPYKQAMAESIAGLMGIPASCVSVKAKTNEGVGEIGRGEAIGCTAVALVRAG